MIPSLCISGGGSGAGKTTVTCALLKTLISRGLRVAAFKCGPDYIDPMFHREVTGVPSSNLDLFMLGAAKCKQLFEKNTREKDIAIIEGVMGFYDGLGGASSKASTYDAARTLAAPVILVEDCAASSLSAAARLDGIARFKRNSMVRGAILNNCPPALFLELKKIIEAKTGITVFGFLPRDKEFRIESRHLGLVTAQEIENLREKIAALACQFEKTVDVKKLLEVSGSNWNMNSNADSAVKSDIPKLSSISASIAIPRDKAFCFYYDDALELLREEGARLEFFSPLAGDDLPAGVCGLYLGGGYPELYAAALAANERLARSVKEAVLGGMPCVAECGGFMYLHKTLFDEAGAAHKLCGVFPGACKKMPRLVRFGYASFTARRGNLFCRAGGTLRGHEFHYWDSENSGDAFMAKKPASGASWQEIIADKTMVAGFPHFHFCARPKTARHFVEACARYRTAHV